MEVQTYQARLNKVSILLGLLIMALGAFCLWFQWRMAGYSTILIAGVICAPIGLLVIYTAISKSKLEVTTSTREIAVGDDIMQWPVINRAVETRIIRSMYILGMKVTLRRLRKLELHADERALEISDEWLRKADYEALRERIAQQKTIVEQIQEEGG